MVYWTLTINEINKGFKDDLGSATKIESEE